MSGWRNIDFEIALDYISEIAGLGHRESETLLDGPAIDAGSLHEGFAGVSWRQDSFLDIGCVFVHEVDVILILGYYRFECLFPFNRINWLLYNWGLGGSIRWLPKARLSWRALAQAQKGGCLYMLVLLLFSHEVP